VESYKPKSEIIINLLDVHKNVHSFLIESEKYNINCLDLEDEITNSLIDWIRTNQIKLKEDFKSLYPKTLPLMNNLENLLKSKLSIERVNIQGSNKDFRINKIAGHWASEIYDSILNSLFLSK
jgi:hypothetical protein